MEETLHRAFAAQRAHLLNIGKLGKSESAFFSDPRLEYFWASATAHLIKMIADGCSEQTAAERIVGGFLTPLWMGYGVTENRSSSARSRKAVVLDSAARSNALRPRAVELAHSLANLLDQIDQEIAPPGCLRLWELAQAELPQVLDGIDTAPCHVHIPSTAYRPRVSDALRRLATELARPVTFDDVPGMRSTRVTWRDWLREARANVSQELDPPLDLREADWIALVRVLVAHSDSLPSRSSVADVLREQM